MENRSHAFAAGLFVLLLGIAVGGAVWYFGGKRNDTDTYLLETRKGVSGLNVQAQVRYRGIRAGKVEAIDPDPRDPRIILVRIELDSRYRLTRATRARLAHLGITGLAYVQLDDSGESHDFLMPDDTAPPRIALDPTLMDTLGERAGDIVGQLAEVSTRLNRLLDEKNTRNLSRTLENVAAASDGLKQAPEILAGLRAVLSKANVERVGAVLAHLEKTAGEAAPLTAEARELVKSMTALSQRLDRFVDTTGGEVGATTLPQLNALVRDMSANSQRLGRLLQLLEESPQALVFGQGPPLPGPGEAGFVAREK